MDPELATLAGTAGTTLVTLLTTDAWHRAKDGFVSLWRRTQPQRAEAIAAEIDATRSDLLSGDAEGGINTRAELSAEWKGRIRRLLTAHPEEMGTLRTLVDELQPHEPLASAVTQHATASGSARVYQAGHDQNFNGR